MPKVYLNGFIVVPDKDLEQVKQALAIHIELTRAEPGCISFSVEQCPDDSHKFFVNEEFDSEASFKKHQERAGSSHWADVTKDVVRNYKITKQ